MQKGHLGGRKQGGGREAQERQETVKVEVDGRGDTQHDLKLYRHKSDEKEEDRKRNKKMCAMCSSTVSWWYVWHFNGGRVGGDRVIHVCSWKEVGGGVTDWRKRMGAVGHEGK